MSSIPQAPPDVNPFRTSTDTATMSDYWLPYHVKHVEIWCDECTAMIGIRDNSGSAIMRRMKAAGWIVTSRQSGICPQCKERIGWKPPRDIDDELMRTRKVSQEEAETVKRKGQDFTEILRRLQAGEIDQVDADRQTDALNKGAAYLRDTALLIQPKRTSRMYK